MDVEAGRRLRLWRIRRGVSVCRCATALGISPWTLLGIERGETHKVGRPQSGAPFPRCGPEAECLRQIGAKAGFPRIAS